MYYIIEQQYAGPNTDQHLNDHKFWIQDTPGLMNMSHAPSLSGWLGTTNDWSEYAHGEHETIEAAISAIDKLIPGGYREDDVDAHEYTGIDAAGEPAGRIVWRCIVGPLEFWDAQNSQQWCYASMQQEIQSSWDDDDIEQFVERCAADLAAEGGKLDRYAVTKMCLEFLNRKD